MDSIGLLVLDGKIREIRKGDVVSIRKGQKHAVKALTALHSVEVQIGDKLMKEDLKRFYWEWSMEQI